MHFPQSTKGLSQYARRKKQEDNCRDVFLVMLYSVFGVPSQYNEGTDCPNSRHLNFRLQLRRKKHFCCQTYIQLPWKAKYNRSSGTREYSISESSLELKEKVISEKQAYFWFVKRNIKNPFLSPTKISFH